MVLVLFCLHFFMSKAILSHTYILYLWSACEEQRNMEEIKMKTHYQILHIVSTVCHASISNL